jgi:hypothetical protein
MRLRALLLGVALACSGCVFHVHGSRNAPGIVDVTTPPPSLKVPVTPEDPGERGILFHGTFLGGVGINRDGAVGTVGFEGGFMPFSLEKSHRGMVLDTAPGGFRFEGGWMAYRGAESHPSTFGPIFAEGQYLLPLKKSVPFGYMSFGVGAALNPQNLGAGPQTTVCLGIHPILWMLCGRGAYMAGGDRGEFYLLLSTSTFVETVWSR